MVAETKFKQHRNLIFIVMGLMSIIFISPVQAQILKKVKSATKKVHKVVKKSTKPHELVTKKNAVKVANAAKLFKDAAKALPNEVKKNKVLNPHKLVTKKNAMKAAKGLKSVSDGGKQIGKIYKDRIIKPVYQEVKNNKVLNPHKVIFKKAKGLQKPVTAPKDKPVTAPEGDSVKKPIDSFSTKLDRLRELKRLLDDGILTQEEFDKEKKKVLDEN